MTADQENELEAALRLAATEPAHRPAFYKALLDATVYVLGHADHGPADGARTLAPGQKVSIQNWERKDGSPVVPFWSSLPELQRAIADETAYMALPARALFELTRGSALVLNPKSSHGKEFFAEEIEALLTEGVNQVARRRVTEEPTRVLLGQPAHFPSKMVDSLTTLFAKHPAIKSGYLALMHDPAHDKDAHLVVGIEFEGDDEAIMREAGVVAADSAPSGATVDLTRVVRGDAGMSAYFLESVKPFYERSWGSKLKSALGFGRA